MLALKHTDRPAHERSHGCRLIKRLTDRASFGSLLQLRDVGLENTLMNVDLGVSLNANRSGSCST